MVSLIDINVIEKACLIWGRGYLLERAKNLPLLGKNGKKTQMLKHFTRVSTLIVSSFRRIGT